MFGMVRSDEIDEAAAHALTKLFGKEIDELNGDADYPEEIKADIVVKLRFLGDYLGKALKSASPDEARDAALAFEAATWLGAFYVTKVVKRPEFLKFVRRKDIEQKRRFREADIIDLPIKYHALNLWRRKPIHKGNAQATATEIVDRVYEDLKKMPRRPKAWMKNLRVKKQRADAIKAIAARIRKLFP